MSEEIIEFHESEEGREDCTRVFAGRSREYATRETETRRARKRGYEFSVHRLRLIECERNANETARGRRRSRRRGEEEGAKIAPTSRRAAARNRHGERTGNAISARHARRGGEGGDTRRRARVALLGKKNVSSYAAGLPTNGFTFQLLLTNRLFRQMRQRAPSSLFMFSVCARSRYIPPAELR